MVGGGESSSGGGGHASQISETKLALCGDNSVQERHLIKLAYANYVNSLREKNTFILTNFSCRLSRAQYVVFYCCC